MVAEVFGTLETLFPGRIDLGLGRAPGTDMATARARRRYLDGADTVPRDVVELLGYLGDEVPGRTVSAVPGTGTHVPVFILGSSLFGAQLAAQLGLPYAVASHFAPGDLEPAIEVYRETFRASDRLAAPWLILAFNVFAAATDAEGRRLRSSMVQAFANLRTGRPGPLPPPVEAVERLYDPLLLAQVDKALACSATGSPATVRDALAAFVGRHAPDELILTGQIHDHAARLRSFEIAAEAMRALGPRPVAAG
jgi:luciferase family oxidoreductase group 1